MNELLPLPDDPLTGLIVSVFRLHGALIAAGDHLVSDLNLTSSRWQVLGAIAASPTPLPVASIARNMGLTRQGVRTVVKELVATGMVYLAPNPHHQRADLVLLTPEGKRTNDAAKARQGPWVGTLGNEIPPERIVESVELLQTLLGRLNEQSQAKHESSINEQPPGETQTKRNET